MKKNELREIYKTKRKNLTKIQKSTFEKNIYQQVMQYDFSNFTNIHIFLSIAKHNEINTQPIIDYLRSIHKNIIVSKSNFNNNTLTHYLLESNTKLLVNKYGIPEPVNAVEINVKEIDLVFVPLLISDQKNYRVGYGKGFYDRFLANCKSNISTIGLNFFTPIKTIKDSNVFDYPLNTVFFPV